MGEWKEIQLGKLGKTYTGLSGKTKDDFGFGKPYVPYLNVFQNNKIEPSQLDFVNIKPDEKQNQVKYGDLFFTTSSETIEEVGMTSVLLHDLGEVYLNSFCFGFRLNDFDNLLPEYVPYLFRSDEIRHKISLQGQGSTRYNLSKTELLKKLILNLPSKPEQTRIAEILSTTDETIAHTEALIAKYQRIKTGLMQDLLTKGIDENGNIRSQETHKFVVKNGVEVPEEWDVITIESIIKNRKGAVKIGPFGSQLKKEYFFTEGIRVYGQENVFEDDFSIGDRRINSERFEQLKSCEIFPGDVLITMMGTIGKSTIAPNNIEKGIMDSHLLRIQVDESKYNKYFLMIQIAEYEGIKRQLKNLSIGSIMEGLNSKIIHALKFVKPSVNEQNQIIEKLNSVSLHILEETKKLSKLHSIKTGLMQDLLSGRVRVNVPSDN